MGKKLNLVVDQLVAKPNRSQIMAIVKQYAELYARTVLDAAAKHAVLKITSEPTPDVPNIRIAENYWDGEKFALVEPDSEGIRTMAMPKHI
jgi:hypothetical protein